MNRLARIARSGEPSAAIQFRKGAYGKEAIEQFLRDVLAMANASVEGPRYIVTGIETDRKGRRIHSISRSDFSGRLCYSSLANEYIEPALRIRYAPVTVDGARVGVYEIGDCQDRPYMMRIDYSETLRRGDAYARIRNAAVKLGRRQLQALFEKKFQDSVSDKHIEIGFPGDILHKELQVVTNALSELPSAVAGAKLHELMEARQKVKTSTTNSFVARLTHARLFGTDTPYEERDTEVLMQEMDEMEEQHQDHDEHFLFDEHVTKVQLVVMNHGKEPVRDASLKLVMPMHPAFRVATRLPKIPRDEHFIERTPDEQAEYPSVNLEKDAIHVSVKIGDIRAGEPTDVFERHLRICAGDELRGRRIGVEYALSAQNLRTPARGRLRLRF